MPVLFFSTAVDAPYRVGGHVVLISKIPSISMVIMVLLGWAIASVRAVKFREVSSAAMARGCGKLFVYMALILMANQASVGSPLALSWAPDLVYAYIGVTELLLIIENINDLGYRMKFLDMVYKFFSLKRVERRLPEVDKFDDEQLRVVKKHIEEIIGRKETKKLSDRATKVASAGSSEEGSGETPRAR